MQVGQGSDQLANETPHLTLWQSFVLSEMTMKSAVRDVLHAQVDALRAFKDLVQAYDIRMANTLQHADLVF